LPIPMGRSLYAHIIKKLRYFWLPFGEVGPIRRAHLALGDILGMTRFERLIAFCAVWTASSALLAKTNQLDLIPSLSQHHMGFGRVAWSRFRLVVT